MSCIIDPATGLPFLPLPNIPPQPPVAPPPSFSPLPPFPNIPPQPPVVVPPAPELFLPPIPAPMPEFPFPPIPDIPPQPPVVPPPSFSPLPPFPDIPPQPPVMPPPPIPGVPVGVDPLTGMSPEEMRVIELTNAIRIQNGLLPVVPEPRLAAAAEFHSQNMLIHDFFGHQGPDGSQLGDRALLTGYPFSFIAENVVPGFGTPEEVVQAWVESPLHLANILNPNVTEIGVGHIYSGNDPGVVTFNHYWTQVLGVQL